MPSKHHSQEVRGQSSAGKYIKHVTIQIVGWLATNLINDAPTDNPPIQINKVENRVMLKIKSRHWTLNTWNQEIISIQEEKKEKYKNG